jgi:histidine triad (HIT) family protein
MSTIFDKIINKEIPCYKIHENDDFMAFLDVNPLAIGHTLVIPKKPQDYIFDMSDSDFMAMHLYSKKIASALKKTIECKKIGVAVIGLEVPHAHIHLVPMNQVGDLNFTAERLTLSSQQYEEVCNQILHFS